MPLISVSNSNPFFTIALNFKYVLINVGWFYFCGLFPGGRESRWFCGAYCCLNCTLQNKAMGKLTNLMTRMAILLLCHAAGVGLASPTVLVTRPVSRAPTERLPTDNQTIYRLEAGESRNLELNTSTNAQSPVFITVSPCTRDFRWAVYRSMAHIINGPVSLLKQFNDGESNTLAVFISKQERYFIQLSSLRGGTVAVSVRGEVPRTVRIRLRIRSRRRLAANWDPSPIDPQSTTYCVVASHVRNYTSLCAALFDAKTNRLDNKSNRFNPELDRMNFEIQGLTSQTDRRNNTNSYVLTEVDNKIEVETDINSSFGSYEGNFKSIYRRKKYGRSTKVTNEDPVIACVGDRTHHLMENLDPSRTYFVSVFGVARDRRAGSLLASGSVRPRTSTAKRLRENVPYRSDIRTKTVYYFKATIGTGGGLWLTLSTCGGAIDVEVLVRGKRLYTAKNIEYHSKFFVPVPIPTSSIQETSDEGSVQFDSSSEEARMRYVIKVVPNRRDRDGSISVEIAASTTRWGINIPELSEDAAIVRELRPKRSCRSIDIAFLPATHNATDVIRYCTVVRESVNGELYTCAISRKSYVKTQCINHTLPLSSKVIKQKINGLKSGRKYAIQVTAASKGNTVPYNVLYVDTNVSCKEEH
ncbi:protein NDNF-like isoform X2 [Achroia grisella]|uniref:protein NDNF-like isoform X2 n=1 Tax=Achroia grisella TaxID=688607 RepID=UPI0027D240EF|nr:protein NDNF-like isoform X2 [Achroia grisella]